MNKVFYKTQLLFTNYTNQCKEMKISFNNTVRFETDSGALVYSVSSLLPHSVSIQQCLFIPSRPLTSVRAVPGELLISSSSLLSVSLQRALCQACPIMHCRTAKFLACGGLAVCSLNSSKRHKVQNYEPFINK